MTEMLLVSFTSPIHIGTTPASMLWMFPLLAAIAISIIKQPKCMYFFSAASCGSSSSLCHPQRIYDCCGDRAESYYLAGDQLTLHPA
jgi:hypothetical protein